ncbi:MAG: 4Fe-4S dicluster domain-containing protein [Candidatus Lokiarchaeota archaeon]|nr:4Fe-4S dicluster domain-containing protein [Candidatus Lokiarchaeota archaeon]
MSIRKLLDHFNISIEDDKRFSCCPEPNGIKNSNELVYSLTAARNLSIAESKNKDILTPCNGCFETLKGIRSEIKSDLHFRNEINEHLEKINLNVSAKSDVFHLVEFFHKLGSDIIKDSIKFPLNGLRVGVHYGCHFLRPSNKIQMDDPMEPHIFDALIEDLGANSIEYDRKMDCCGGSLDRAGKADFGLEMVHDKLEAMKDQRIDCIVVGCPQCFIQFDHLQQDLKKLDYVYDIPVLYYSELLCIALGLDIKEIMTKYHRTPVEKVYEKIDSITRKNKLIKDYFDIEFLKKCFKCGACNNDCPVAKITDFDPNKLIGQLLNGDINSVIQDPSIWMCLDCFVCYELCPSKVGLVEIFTKLRNLAREKGFVVEGFRHEYDSFKKMGTIAMFSKAARKRVGLDSNKPELEDLKKILNEIEEEK